MGEVHYMTRDMEQVVGAEDAQLRPTLSLMNKPTGSRPSIEWVLVADLKVDDTYQRDVENRTSRTLIASIARNWDWRMCMPLVVSRRDDGLYVIDGQHRQASALERGDIDQLPCMISRYASLAEEAEMFVRMNRARRQMNRLDDFHAAQVSGDSDAVAVANLIESVGFSVSRRTGSASWVPGEVAFTSSISTIRRKHGDGIVRDTLQMMADAFPDERLTAGSSIFTALCRTIINPPPELDRDRLFRALLKFNMAGWASFLKGAKGGDDRAQKLREILLIAYDEVGEGASA